MSQQILINSSWALVENLEPRSAYEQSLQSLYWFFKLTFNSCVAWARVEEFRTQKKEVTASREQLLDQ